MSAFDPLKKSVPVPTRFQVADCVKFYELAPSEKGSLFETWHARGQNFVVAHTVAKDGAVLERADQADEYMLILPKAEVAVTITAGGETREIDGHSLTIVPPGKSAIAVRKGGPIVRIFTSLAADLAALCLNKDSYRQPDPNVAAYAPWPAPQGGYRIRSYSLDVAAEPGRFGRIWRSANLMANVFYPQGPRDIAKMTPHHHDDFQQGLLVLEGECIHHLRWPWLADLRLWQEDEHIRCGGPSLSIFPPPAIHTSQMIGADNFFIDIFSPPREDFCNDGWVLNDKEYPRPAK
jgi:hypothetical protein